MKVESLQNSTYVHRSPSMSRCNEVMNEPTPIKPGGPSGCSSSAPGVAEAEQPAPLTATTMVEDEELWELWESDWSSEWEDDWESGGEKDPFVRKMEVIQADDSEPKIKKLKSMKILTGDDRISPSKAERGGCGPASDEDIIELVDDSTDSEEEDDNTDLEEKDDSFDSGEEAALAPGLACHYCHRRNVKQKVQCSRCPIRMCGLCLQNRNGEKLEVETQEGVKWVCPKCRAGCGPGCNTCCICAPCRKRRGLPPTGQLIRLARQVGFDNVHDYLIYRETGESSEKIAKRKEGRGWTKAGGAMSSRFSGATVGMLQPAQFWADCATAKQQFDIQRTPGREAKIIEGSAWTKAGPGAMSSRSNTVATVGVLKPAQLWADCVTAKQAVSDLDGWQTSEKIAQWEKGEGWATAGGAMSSRFPRATVGALNPVQFWADCAPANPARVALDIQRTPDKIIKGNEGKGWAQAGSAMSSRSTGATVGILKPAELTSDRGPVTRASDEINNHPSRQQKRLAWTMPKAVGALWKSTNSNVHRRDKDQGGASLPCGDIEKTTDVSETVKSNNSEHERAVARTVLHQVLGRETKQPVHVKLSLDQILNRLLNPENQAAQDRSGIRQMRRNRKHRKMGRILEPSMFRKRKSKNDQATNISTNISTNDQDTANPGVLPTIMQGKMDDVHLDQSSKAAAIVPGNEPKTMQAKMDDVHLDQSSKASSIVPENKPTFQPAGQTAHDGRHHHGRPSFSAPIYLKRPVTSLQALRKMGVFANRSTADITALQESAQKPGLPTTAPPLVAHSSDQSFPFPATSRPSRSGSQAILMRHIEKRKKLESRSCLKPQSTTAAVPSTSDSRLTTEVAAWRGELARSREKVQPLSRLGQFSQTRSVTTGFKFPKRHVSEVQSGFESFSEKETVIGFGSFRGEETGLSALKT